MGGGCPWTCGVTSSTVTSNISTKSRSRMCLTTFGASDAAGLNRLGLAIRNSMALSVVSLFVLSAALAVQFPDRGRKVGAWRVHLIQGSVAPVMVTGNPNLQGTDMKCNGSRLTLVILQVLALRWY